LRQVETKHTQLHAHAADDAAAGFVWDRTSFAAFIANPRGKIPGNKMVFAGIKNETEIANLWTYLSHFNVDGSSK
jgi:cytochrome c